MLYCDIYQHYRYNDNLNILLELEPKGDEMQYLDMQQSLNSVCFLW